MKSKFFIVGTLMVIPLFGCSGVASANLISYTEATKILNSYSTKLATDKTTKYTLECQYYSNIPHSSNANPLISQSKKLFYDADKAFMSYYGIDIKTLELIDTYNYVKGATFYSIKGKTYTETKFDSTALAIKHWQTETATYSPKEITASAIEASLNSISSESSGSSSSSLSSTSSSSTSSASAPINNLGVSFYKNIVGDGLTVYMNYDLGPGTSEGMMVFENGLFTKSSSKYTIADSANSTYTMSASAAYTYGVASFSYPDTSSFSVQSSSSSSAPSTSSGTSSTTSSPSSK